ncbi:MAG: hypothetical protein HY360_15755 [Verrucomicrobia bacterium]|nr:hypothetical protein [Verrucomicrobiota bacterium]
MKKVWTPVRVNPVLLHPHENRISLGGEWNFRLDPEDRGLTEQWFSGKKGFSEKIAVPGCWQGQGFGSDAKDTVRDFNLVARTYQATYTGTGWYARSFNAPSEWKGKRLWLNFGGAHPSAEVWLNGIHLGENDLPFVPFGFEITAVVRWDGSNTIVVRVHERNREFGHVYNWEGNWSGLYRNVEITATGACFLESCAIHPDVDSESMRFRARLGGDACDALLLQASAAPIGTAPKAFGVEAPVREREFEFTLEVPAPRLWRPEIPELYRVDLTLRQGTEILDAWSERVGFVKLTAEGRQLCINNQPYYWRGSGDHLACPETGCPDANRDRWRRKLRVLREYGYNFVRCPSFVYTPEYFDAADEAGLLIQSEPGGIGPWGGHSVMHAYSWPKPTPDNYPIMKRQWDLSVLRDVNHPSANIYCMSNEFGIVGCRFPRIAWEYYRATKAIKPTALVIWTDGAHDENMPGDFVNGEASQDGGVTKPLIQHEFRWWSAFPDVRIMHKYSGAMRPFAAEIAQQAARRWGLERVLTDAAVASQRLQFLEAKGKLEMMRRDHPNLAGISHFNGADVGASAQGIVDQFYERKYADAALWRQTNHDTVVLSGLNFDDRVLEARTTFRCRLYVSDFSHPPLNAPVLEWRLVIPAGEIASGRIRYAHKPYGAFALGEIEVSVPVLAEAAAARLEVRLAEGNRIFTNSWNLWILPPKKPLPQGLAVHGPAQYSWLKDCSDIPTASPASFRAKDGPKAVLTERLDAALVEYMRGGGRVLLVATEGLVRPHPMLFPAQPYYAGIWYFFTPPANYGPYEDGQNGTIIRNHPMLGGLPHEGFADLQFFRLIENAPPIDLAPLDLGQAEPVIRVIHRYPVFRPLAYLIEGRCGRGGLILCALDLNPAFPEARYLLCRICEYATGAGFLPAQDLSHAALDRIVTCTALP